MKIKLYHFILPVAALGCAIWAIQDQGSRYEPREVLAKEGATGIYGAFEYLNMVRANPTTGLVDPEEVVLTRKAVQAASNTQTKALGLQWIEMGPDNVGGRTRALVIDPNNSNVLYAGGVSGGLWKSTDAANTWNQVTSFSESMIVSSAAVLQNGHIYVGTGSTFDNPSGAGGSGFLGHGLFRSTDGGNSFQAMETPSTNFSGTVEWTEVDELTADPNDPNRVWIGWDRGFGYYDEDDGSLTELGPISGNGIPSNQRCTDIKISPDGSTFAVTMLSQDGYISTDGGQNFNLISTGGNNPPAAAGRLEFAISPDDPDFIYALVASPSARLAGVWATDDRGSNWSQVWPSGTDAPSLDLFNPNMNPQGIYDNVISVVPGQPGVFWAGGVQLWRGTSVGQPVQIAVNASFPGCFVCVHSDVHAIVWDPNNPLVAYIGTDGGVYKTFDGGQTFLPYNRGYNVTQFYSVAYSPQNHVMGGTQDNSTPYINLQGNTTEEAEVLYGGDGFDCDISQIDSKILFATSQYGVFGRSSDEGNSFSDFYDQSRMGPMNLGGTDGRIGSFFTNIRLYENYDDPDSPDSTIAFHSITVAADDTLPIADLIGQSITYDFLSGKVPVIEYSEQTVITFDMIVDSTIMPNDTVFGGANGVELLLSQQYPDRVESLFAIGYTGTLGVWVTRDALNFTVTPEWWKVVEDIPGTVNTLEWSADGDCLFIGSTNGDVYRVCGFDQAHTAETAEAGNMPSTSNLDSIVNVATGDTITSNFQNEDYANNEYVYIDGTPVLYKLSFKKILDRSGIVTGLGPDPNNSDRLLVTYGGYGSSQKVHLSEDATQANPTFQNVWNVAGNLQGMPVYDGIISAADPNIFVIGTEFGAMASDDEGQSWSFEDNGLDRVPVFAVRQQTWDANYSPFGATYVQNPYVIFLGTHGRGIYRSESLLSVEPAQASSDVHSTDLRIFPNPAIDVMWFELTLSARTDLDVKVLDMNGRIVYSLTPGSRTQGTHRIDLSIEQLPSATYFLQVNTDTDQRIGRFVKQ